MFTLLKSGSVIVNMSGSNTMIPPTIAEIPIRTNLRLLKNILLSILSIVKVLKTFFNLFQNFCYYPFFKFYILHSLIFINDGLFSIILSFLYTNVMLRCFFLFYLKWILLWYYNKFHK